MASWLRALFYWLMKDPDRYAPEFAETPDPVDVHALSIPREVGCDVLSDMDVAVIRANTEALTDEQRVELDAAFTDALTLLNGPVPYVPGPYYPEETQ